MRQNAWDIRVVLSQLRNEINRVYDCYTSNPSTSLGSCFQEKQKYDQLLSGLKNVGNMCHMVAIEDGECAKNGFLYAADFKSKYKNDKSKNHCGSMVENALAVRESLLQTTAQSLADLKKIDGEHLQKLAETFAAFVAGLPYVDQDQFNRFRTSVEARLSNWKPDAMKLIESSVSAASKLATLESKLVESQISCVEKKGPSIDALLVNGSLETLRGKQPDPGLTQISNIYKNELMPKVEPILSRFAELSEKSASCPFSFVQRIPSPGPAAINQCSLPALKTLPELNLIAGIDLTDEVAKKLKFQSDSIQSALKIIRTVVDAIHDPQQLTAAQELYKNIEPQSRKKVKDLNSYAISCMRAQLQTLVKVMEPVCSSKTETSGYTSIFGVNLQPTAYKGIYPSFSCSSYISSENVESKKRSCDYLKLLKLAITKWEVSDFQPLNAPIVRSSDFQSVWANVRDCSVKAGAPYPTIKSLQFTLKDYTKLTTSISRTSTLRATMNTDDDRVLNTTLPEGFNGTKLTIKPALQIAVSVRFLAAISLRNATAQGIKDRLKLCENNPGEKALCKVDAQVLRDVAKVVYEKIVTYIEVEIAECEKNKQDCEPLIAEKKLLDHDFYQTLNDPDYRPTYYKYQSLNVITKDKAITAVGKALNDTLKPLLNSCSTPNATLNKINLGLYNSATRTANNYFKRWIAVVNSTVDLGARFLQQEVTRTEYAFQLAEKLITGTDVTVQLECP
jgi:hypothetical protein